jgi:hypothetical protein
VRATVDNAPGATLRIVTDNTTTLVEVPIDSQNFTYTFTAPQSSTWLRAEVYYNDAGDTRAQLQAQCDVIGTATSPISGSNDVAYCRDRLAVVAMTSALYVQAPTFDPTTTLTYLGDATARLGSVAALAAALKDSSGVPLAGAPVTFAFRGQSYQATTDASGVAATRVKVTGPPGSYEISSTYPGSDTYLASSDLDTFVVTAAGPKG